MSLRDLYEQYQDHVQFLMIYIREAHPRDGWWLGGAIKGRFIKRYSAETSTDIYDPTTIEERRTVAKQCEDALRYGVRTYVDEMDDRVSKTRMLLRLGCVFCTPAFLRRG